MRKKKINLMKLLLPLFLLFLGCSGEVNRAIKNSKEKLSENKPYEALQILDERLRNESSPKNKIKILNEIEVIIKTKIKKAYLYKAVLEQKIRYTEEIKSKNDTKLLLAQLLIQNLRDEISALDILENIKVEQLSNSQREQYFQMIIVSYINAKKNKQAMIEVANFLKRKDLAPSETFKLKQLQARIYTDLKQYAKAENIYEDLVKKYHNLSKKWKVRSQLAFIYESQQKYKEAVVELEKMQKEDDDPFLKWRIEDLNKRIAQLPGGKGRLRR